MTVAVFKASLLVVSRSHDVAPMELLGRSKVQRVSRPRQEVMWLARREGRLSYSEIGRLAGRHYSSVIEAERVVDDRCRRIVGYADFLERLKREVRAALHGERAPPALREIARRVLDAPRPEAAVPPAELRRLAQHVLQAGTPSPLHATE